MVRNAPCLNCTDRELGCHSKCGKYLDFTAQRKAEVEARLAGTPIWEDYRLRSRRNKEAARRARKGNMNKTRRK